MSMAMFLAGAVGFLAGSLYGSVMTRHLIHKQRRDQQ